MKYSVPLPAVTHPNHATIRITCTQSTRSATAPESTTVPASSALCPAMYPSAHAADSFTPGSNSSRHATSESSAPLSTTA